MTSRIATTTGWTIPQIDDLLLPEVWDLFAYWEGCPPAHEMIAAYFKIKPKPRRRGKKTEEGDKWWESIEEKYVKQDLGGFLAEAGGHIRRDRC